MTTGKLGLRPADLRLPIAACPLWIGDCQSPIQSPICTPRSQPAFGSLQSAMLVAWGPTASRARYRRGPNRRSSQTMSKNLSNCPPSPRLRRVRHSSRSERRRKYPANGSFFPSRRRPGGRRRTFHFHAVGVHLPSTVETPNSGSRARQRRRDYGQASRLISIG
jgi:hypothetical protein